MKKIIFTIAAIVSINFSSLAAANPSKSITVFESTLASINMDERLADLFVMTAYNPEKENFFFETKESISFIQIFQKNGELAYQLPVMSNKVTISNSILGKGDYKLGFMIKGMKDVQFTTVTVK